MIVFRSPCEERSLSFIVKNNDLLRALKTGWVGNMTSNLHGPSMEEGLALTTFS
jgi:hypothetical protein